MTSLPVIFRLRAPLRGCLHPTFSADRVNPDHVCTCSPKDKVEPNPPFPLPYLYEKYNTVCMRVVHRPRLCGTSTIRQLSNSAVLVSVKIARRGVPQRALCPELIDSVGSHAPDL